MGFVYSPRSNVKIKVMLKNFKNGYAVAQGSNKAKNEKNDWVVRAVANACEVSYDEAHKFVGETFDRKKGQGTLLFSFIMKQIKTIKFNGPAQLSLFDNNDGKTVNVKHVGDMPKAGGKLFNPKYKHKKVAYTVKEFARKFNKGNYILAVNKHALAVCDGVIVDNNNYQTDGYRRVVESAFRIS